MLLSVSLLVGMLLVWLVVTAVCIALGIYRAVIGLREEDQLFIDPGKERLLREQRELITKLERIRPYFIGSVLTAVVLGVATFALWVYQQLR